MLTQGDAPMMLLNLMEENEYKQHNIAKPAGISIATLCNFLKGERLLSFQASLTIHNSFFKKNDGFIKKVCTSYENKKDVRPSLEYLSVNYYTEELSYLLKKIKGQKPLKEEYLVYSLILSYQKREKSVDQLLSEIKIINREVKSIDLIVLLNIIEANIYGMKREHKSLFRLSNEIEEMFHQVKDEFIKESLQARLYEVVGQAYLFCKCDIEKARKYANLIISSKISAKLNSYAYYLLGTSYLFQDCGKATEHLYKSVKGYSDLGLHTVKEAVSQSIYVAETFWGDNLNVINEDMHRSEVAHRLAKKGERDKAVEILDTLGETSFKIYYRALAENDMKLHFKALGGFIREGDFFFAQFPLKELEQSDEYRDIARSIYYN